jgi:hypothetical protein
MGPDTPLFLPVVTYDSGGDESHSVAVADVNGDGKPDLLVANYCVSSNNCAEGSVGVLLGRGDGTFQPAVAYSSGGSTTASLAVADLNGDGKPDLVVASQSGSVGVLLGIGDGTFQPVVTYSAGGAVSVSVAVADVNGDGKPDLLVANQCDTGVGNCKNPSVGVLLGTGDGTFQAATTYAALDGLDSLAVADVNGDGKPDLLVTSGSNNNNIGVLLGNGNGTFQPVVAYSSGGEGAMSVAVADANGDGKPDLVVGNTCLINNCAFGSVGVLLGNGDGTFQPAVAYNSGGSGAWSVAVADVNGDGIPDLVVVSYFYYTVDVLLGNGDGTFQTATTYGSGGIAPTSVAVADLNGDGKPDIAVANFCNNENFCPTGTVGVLLNNTGPLASTTTTLTSSPNPSVYGQAVTLTAVVSSGGGTPPGTVKFLDGSTTLGTATLVNGSASISASSLAAGTHSITAAYQGGAGFAASTSTALTQTVSMATTTTTLASSLNPAASGQSVTFTATVTSQFGGASTGSVVFSSGSQTLGTASLSGNLATLTTSFASPGTYSISAKYNGDGNNKGSTSSILSEVIIAATTTALVSSPNPSVVGQAVTFTATVSSTSGTPPNGELITFKNGSAMLGTSPLAGGVASLTTSSLAAGVYSITASYGGDVNFAASTSTALRQVVNSTTKSATTTTLVSSLNPSIYGQKVTWTATVTTSGSIPPAGMVNFTWGHGYYSFGTATLNASGVATLTRSMENADTYALTAVYSGDANNLGSTSAALNQVITEATSSATLASLPNPSTLGQSVTFTATISSPTGTPTGPVTFAAGKIVLGTAQLAKGKATFTTSTLAAGSTKVTATYYGDSNISASSASVVQIVH